MTEPLTVFEQNISWATTIARNVHRHVPPSFELDDLAQEALIALWKKSELYDANSGVPFRAYAYLYVRGAVLMKCRRRHWADHTMYELVVVEEEDSNARTAKPMPVSESVDPALERERQEAEELQYRLRHKWLLRELKTLPVFDAYIVRRVYIDGVDLSDIARARQMERGTLSRRLSVAVKRLKKAASMNGWRLTQREPETNGKSHGRADHALVA